MKAKVFRGTWLQRPGTQISFTSVVPGSGLRVLEHQWADEATATVSVLEGDLTIKPGYPGAGVEYLKVEGVEPGTGTALVAALVDTAAQS